MLLEQFHLIDALVFRFLMPDVLAYHLFVSTYGRDEIASRPKVLAHEIATHAHVGACNVDRTLAFDVPDYLRDGVLRIPSASDVFRVPVAWQ